MQPTTSSALARPNQGTFCLSCGNVVERPHLAPRLAVYGGGLPVLWRPSIKSMARDVARRRGNVTVEEIFSTAREFRIAHARQEVFWEGRRRGMSWSMIGRHFPSCKPGVPHMDHTSIIHGDRQHRRRLREAVMAHVAAENAEAARIHGAA